MYPIPLSVLISKGFLVSFSILVLSLPTRTSIDLLSEILRAFSCSLASSIEFAISSRVRAIWLLARKTFSILVSF